MAPEVSTEAEEGTCHRERGKGSWKGEAEKKLQKVKGKLGSIHLPKLFLWEQRTITARRRADVVEAVLLEILFFWLPRFRNIKTNLQFPFPVGPGCRHPLSPSEH